LLLDGRLGDRGIFDRREVARLWDEHRTRRGDHPHRLWQLVMLELWFRQFIDGRPEQFARATTRSTHATGNHAASPAAWTPAARTVTEAT